MGKKRVIAETGAGQHGVATATVAALFGMECEVFMGEEDIRRQAPTSSHEDPRRRGHSGHHRVGNAQGRHERGHARLGDPCPRHLLFIGSVAGPHPYPMMVRDFQSVIGRETRRQILKQERRLPDFIIACVGGGSNAMGLFYPFRNDENVTLIGVEAAGMGIETACTPPPSRRDSRRPSRQQDLSAAG